jgi:hypothetical protein
VAVLERAPNIQPDRILETRTAGVMFAEAIRDPRIIDSRAGLAIAVQSAKVEDIPSLIAAYENSPPGGDTMFSSIMLMTAWGKYDGPAAAAYASEHMDGWRVRVSAEVAMQAWAEHDPDAAVEWLSTQENPEQENWFAGLVAGVAHQNLLLASDLMEGMEYGRLRGRAADKVLDAYQRLGTQRMLSYVNSVDDEQLMPGLQRKAAVRLAALAPQKYTSWVMGIDDPSNRQNALNAYMREWAKSDPEQAVNYLDSIKDEGLQANGMNAVIATWVEEDVAAAAAWISEMDQGRLKDSSLSQVSNRLLRDQPAVALEYALQIADGQARRNAVNRVTEQWVRRDPTGATEVLGEETVRATQAAMKK